MTEPNETSHDESNNMDLKGPSACQTLLQCGVEKIVRGETDLIEMLSVCIK